MLGAVNYNSLPSRAVRPCAACAKFKTYATEFAVLFTTKTGIEVHLLAQRAGQTLVT